MPRWTLLLCVAACLAAAASTCGQALAADSRGAICGRGYDYAGIAGWGAARGVAATLSIVSTPRVHAGHVAAWVGVGGRGLGAGGADAWIQSGLSALPGGGDRIYSETTEPGKAPVYRELARVRPGESHRVAIVMESPERWVVRLDGRLVVGPVRLPGSAGWRPVATAESWSPGSAPCNSFAYRFDRVAAISSGSRTWQPLTRAAVLEAAPRYGITRAGASFAAASHA